MVAREMAAAGPIRRRISANGDFGNTDLCELKCDVALMSHGIRADRNYFVPHSDKRPKDDLLASPMSVSG